MFVAPDAMRQGVGRALYDDACDIARNMGLTELQIEADPHAVGFYERRGARRIGEAPSQSIAGRVLPLLVADVSSEA